MPSRLSTAVIGAGAAGAAAALALSRRSCAVTVFEQFAPGHHHGSSHGPTRLFRTAYFEHPGYTPLLKEAARRWRDLERAARAPLLELCGVFMAGRPDTTLMSGTRRAAHEHDLKLETLTRKETAARFPWFVLDDDMDALIEPEAGFLYADRCLNAMRVLARECGAVINDNAPVTAWRSETEGVALQTAAGWQRFDRVVMAPGAYASRLLGDVGEPVTAVRKHLFWAGEDTLTLANGFPPFGIEEADGRFFYGFPAIDADGVKLGLHTGGAPLIAPDAPAPGAAEQDRQEISDFLARRAPGLALRDMRQDCLYEMSPDGHFIIDAHPDDPRVVFAIGLSGHGFKFAPTIGEALADIALSGQAPPEVAFLGLQRFDDPTAA